MNSMTKFAVFLTLAGVLAVLFTFIPGDHPKVIHTEKAKTFPEKTEQPESSRPAKPASHESRGTDAPSRTMIGENNFSPKLKVPAVRGVTNYGWVELPRGTRVSLVRESGDNLWVRWDGTLVKVPQGIARSGAVVVR